MMNSICVRGWCDWSLPWPDARDTELTVFIQDLMRELDEKEEVIKSVQDKAERLMLKNHPARLTIEVSPFSVYSE